MSNGDTNTNRPESVGAHGLRKSQFQGKASIPGTATFDYVDSGTNYKITFQDLNTALGVTGTIQATSESGTTPVLDAAGTSYTIRNLKAGSGIGLALTAQNSIEISQGFTVSTDGAAVLNEATDPSTIRSIKAGDGISVGISGEAIQITATGAEPVTGKTVQINEMSDFPAPVSGVITLSDDTNYSINNDLTTSNRFVLGNQTKLSGAGNLIISMEYTGTGVMFSSQDNINSLSGIAFSCASGTFLNWENTGGNEGTDSLSISDCAIVCDTAGTFTSGNTLFIEDTTVICTTDGLTVGGTQIDNILVSTGAFAVSAGTAIDFGTASIRSVRLSVLEFEVDSGATAISGAAASGNITSDGLGRLGSISFFGLGTYVNGIASSDDRWEVAGCIPIENSRTDGLLSVNGNTNETTITASDTPVKANAVFTVNLDSRMTGDTTGRLTYNPVSPENLPITVTILMNRTGGGGGGDLVSAYIAINGSVITETQVQINADNDENTSITTQWQHKFQQDDFVEVWVENNDDTSNIIAQNVILRVN